MRKEGRAGGRHVGGDMLLPPVILCWVLLSQHDEHEEVVPLEVVMVAMLLKPTALRVKGEAINSADEALVIDLGLGRLPVRAELAKRVDDDTKDDVEQDDAHEEPKRDRVQHLKVVEPGL